MKQEWITIHPKYPWPHVWPLFPLLFIFLPPAQYEAKEVWPSVIICLCTAHTRCIYLLFTIRSRHTGRLASGQMGKMVHWDGERRCGGYDERSKKTERGAENCHIMPRTVIFCYRLRSSWVLGHLHYSFCLFPWRKESHMKSYMIIPWCSSVCHT